MHNGTHLQCIPHYTHATCVHAQMAELQLIVEAAWATAEAKTYAQQQLLEMVLGKSTEKPTEKPTESN